MKCSYCRNTIHPEILDWCYMMLEDGVRFAHLICVEYDQEMERIETEEYLASVLSF